MSNKDGGPAFPRPGFFGDESPGQYDNEPDLGMSLRDWFEGRAMQGLLTNPSMISPGQLKAAKHHSNLLALAEEIADAWLAKREKRCAEPLK